LPSETPPLIATPPGEKLSDDKPQRETRRRESPPGELSADALSAIFDEPIGEVEAESNIGEHDEVQPEAATELQEALSEADGADEDFDDADAAPPDDFAPEFEDAPRVAVGTKPVEEELVPTSLDVPQREHPAAHAPAAAHAEPSMVPPAQKLDVEEMIDMTAMVDIVFFLLIFFLVTSMHTLDSTIPMPAPDPQKGAAKEPQTVAAIDADDSYIVVRIDKNDKITVEGTEVRTERDVLFKLRELRLGASRPEKLMVIGHGDATHGTAVMILDAGRELGMEHVKLSVQDEEE
jgi:biopolymer transport protein ExbD